MENRLISVLRSRVLKVLVMGIFLKFPKVLKLWKESSIDNKVLTIFKFLGETNGRPLINIVQGISVVEDRHAFHLTQIPREKRMVKLLGKATRYVLTGTIV